MKRFSYTHMLTAALAFSMSAIATHTTVDRRTLLAILWTAAATSLLAGIVSACEE